MKRISLLLIAIIACLLTVAAQNDSTGSQSQVTETQIEYPDTPDPGNSIRESDEDSGKKHSRNFGFNPIDIDATATLAIICVFGLPVVIVFIAFYFRYKNRKAKYQLAEKALESGQPIPEEFFKNMKSEGDTQQKGIKNIFTGLGLFIFLWAITNEFSIGCIGLLIMFTGFGQMVIHYTQNNKKGKDKYNNGNKYDDQNPSIEG